MLAALTTERIRPKLVTVVDEDIDVRDPEKSGVSAIMAIDATRPYGQDFAEVADVPGADSFVIPGWTDGPGDRVLVKMPSSLAIHKGR